MKKILLFALSLFFSFSLLSTQNLAAVFVVENVNDTGAGSLRDAVNQANQTPEEDVIVFNNVVFSSMSTIVLNSEIVIMNPLQIVGLGEDILTISGNNNNRIFYISSGVNVSLSKLTIADGKSPAPGQMGFSVYAGGIYNDGGQLYLSQVTIRDCTAEQAAGVYSRMGVLHIVNSTIRNNQAIEGRSDGSYGGGIDSQGELVIRNSVITENTARGGSSNMQTSSAGSGVGGGIRVFSGTVDISNSIITDNSALGGNRANGFGGNANGGGLSISGSTGIIKNTLIDNNRAIAGTGDIPSRAGRASGGGIANLVDLKLINVTLSNNEIDTTNFDSNGGGGGIINFCAGCLRITNSTIVNNTANDYAGGGISANSSFIIRNSIVAGNTAGFGPDIRDTAISNGNNIIGNGANSGGLQDGVNNDRVGTSEAPIDPLLGPLADNGGLSKTYMPLAGSPAIDNGNNCVVLDSGSGGCLDEPLFNDQRGYARPDSSSQMVDIGAVETNSIPFVLNAPGTPDLLDTSDLGISNSDDLTSSRNPVFSVDNVPAGATVELVRNNVTVASVYSETGGSVLLTDSPINDGLFNYSAKLSIDGSSSPMSSTIPVRFDTVKPTVTVNQATTQSDPTASGTVNFDIFFDEPVFNFNSSGISLSNSTANVSSANVTVTGSGMNYTVEVSGIVSDGQFVEVNVEENSAIDAAGNHNAVSSGGDNTVVIDNVAPTVMINQAVSQPDPTSAQPVNFTVVFSETVSGFDASDISLADSTAGVGSALLNVTGSGTTYNIAVSNVTSSGTVVANVLSGAAQDALGNISSASTSIDNSVNFRSVKTLFDLDGDGKTDIGIFRPAPGEWWYLRSSDGIANAFQFGASTDTIVPADFTGDGATDIAFFRESTGDWFVLRSEDSSFFAFPFGTAGDIPAPADYDGDGTDDPAVFRPSDATWYILNSGGGTTIQQFGANGDIPIAQDYDGDGKYDLAIFRPSVSEWYFQRSSDFQVIGYQFGTTGDKAVPADYTGDGKADVAFWRPSSGEWYILRSEDSSFFAFPFGTNGDIPVPGDYDGDGTADAAVFRPSNNTWFLQQTTDGFEAVGFGINGDVPIPSAYIP